MFFTKKNRTKIIYILKHKVAYSKVERELTGKISLRGLTHDLDKLLMCLVIPADLASKIHNKYSRHHGRRKSHKDWEEVAIDWECARLTKKDKQLNAYDFLMLKKPYLKDRMLPILRNFKIDKPLIAK